MKVLILAGGLGTRISEETSNKPKPMVLIDDKPILWHIMNTFALQGFTDFLIATGYRSEVIEQWILTSHEKEWNIQVLNTGLNTQTGGRIKQAIDFLTDEAFIATYGDGLCNVPIRKLLDLYERNTDNAVVTAVRPPARFGYLKISGSRVTHFGEKLQTDEGWINGGFFILNKKVSKYIKSNEEPFEAGALTRMASEGKLSAYKHEGFFFPMDTLREKNELQKMAKLNPPPWLSNLG